MLDAALALRESPLNCLLSLLWAFSADMLWDDLRSAITGPAIVCLLIVCLFVWLDFGIVLRS